MKISEVCLLYIFLIFKKNVLLLFFVLLLSTYLLKQMNLFFQLPGDEESGLTCRTYVFQDESHTLGNALKCIINR